MEGRVEDAVLRGLRRVGGEFVCYCVGVLVWVVAGKSVKRKVAGCDVGWDGMGRGYCILLEQRIETRGKTGASNHSYLHGYIHPSNLLPSCLYLVPRSFVYLSTSLSSLLDQAAPHSAHAAGY